MENTEEAARVQYVYDFAKLDRVPERQTSLRVTARGLVSGDSLETAKSSTTGAVLSGERVICTLGTQARGTGAKAHAHPNEQFNYILRGTMMSDVEGDRVFAPPGSILHTPGGIVHTGLACPDEDLVFLAVKDMRAGMVGSPVDGRYDGPNCFAGFGSRAHEPRQSTADVMEESRRLPPGPGKRYVYDMRSDSDTRPELASARVTTDAELRLPPGIRGKLLTGERLHVGVLRFDRGATFNNYRLENEQLVFVVDGELEVHLEGEQITVKPRCLLHVPPGIEHALRAVDHTTIVLAQDSHGAAA